MEILRNKSMLMLIILIFSSCNSTDKDQKLVVEDFVQNVGLIDFLALDNYCNMDKLIGIDCEIEISNGKFSNFGSLNYNENSKGIFYDIKYQENFWFSNVKRYNSQNNFKFIEGQVKELSIYNKVAISDYDEFKKFEKLFEEAVNLNKDFNQFEDSILVELVLFKKGEYRKIRLSYNEIDSVKIFKSFLP